MKNTLQADEIVYEMPCVRMRNRIKKPQWPERRAVGEVHYEAWQAGPHPKPAASLCKKKPGLLKPEKPVSVLYHGTACLPLLDSLLKYSSHLRWLANAVRRLEVDCLPLLLSTLSF